MTRCLLVVPLLAILSQPAGAQSGDAPFQVTVALAGVRSGEFDTTDTGVSVRFAWHPTPLIGSEAEVSFYPSEFAGFSGHRVEGLFGVTLGPRLGRVRPFAKLRPGLVRFGESSGPIACIAIFPPPLACRLAAGETVFAVDVGGGVELFPGGRTLFRVDAGDRLVRYPGPVFDRRMRARGDAFFSHDFRFTVGAGVRF